MKTDYYDIHLMHQRFDQSSSNDSCFIPIFFSRKYVNCTFALVVIFYCVTDIPFLTLTLQRATKLSVVCVCVFFQAANLNHSGEDRLKGGWIYPA